MVGALVDDIHHQAVEYVDDAVGVLGDRRIVRNHDQRVVVALGHLLDEAENFLARAAVQVARRFVGKDDLRVGNERARNAHALLLAAAHLGGAVVHVLFQPQFLKHFARGGKALLG